MRTGTPSFQPSRLKAAREARCMTGAALAELVGVTRSSISQYERAEQTPSPMVLNRLSNVLNLPGQYFCSTPLNIDAPVFYRSFSTALKRSRIRAERRLEWLQEIVVYLSEMMEFPNLELPSVDLPSDILELSLEDVEDVAKVVRRDWGLSDGPISNLVRLVENNGLIVTRHFLDTEKLDAFSCMKTAFHRPVIVLSMDKECSVRSRYNLAHELGHVILHRQVDQASLKNRNSFKRIELQAHRFAGAFLLPATTFLRELFSPSLDAFLAQKERWGVSVAMMVKRCEDLGVVNEELARRLWRNLARRGWRKHEPLDDTIAIEKPMLLQRSFDLLLQSDEMCREGILRDLPWSSAEIESLAGLTAGTLDTESGEDASAEPRIIRFPSA